MGEEPFLMTKMNTSNEQNGVWHEDIINYSVFFFSNGVGLAISISVCIYIYMYMYTVYTHIQDDPSITCLD